MTQNPHTPPKDQQEDEQRTKMRIDLMALLYDHQDAKGVVDVPAAANDIMDVFYDLLGMLNEYRKTYPSLHSSGHRDDGVDMPLIVEKHINLLAQTYNDGAHNGGFDSLPMIKEIMAWHEGILAQARKGYKDERPIDKARYSNIESIVHGGLVEWGWDITTANEAQARITKDVLAYMAQHTVPKADVAAKVAEAQRKAFEKVYYTRKINPDDDGEVARILKGYIAQLTNTKQEGK